MQESSPIIIFGVPRSGTTYRSKLLNTHPDVFISHEIRLFAWVHLSLRALTQQSRCMMSCKTQFGHHVRSVFLKMLRDFYAANWPQTRYWGDKNPHHAHPEKKLFEFLGIPLHPAVERFCHEQTTARTAFHGPTRDLAAGANVSDWAKVMSPADQLRTSELLGAKLICQGYETEATLADARARLTCLAVEVPRDSVEN